MKLEDLKVGEKYVHANSICELLFIGEKKVFIGRSDLYEYDELIEIFLNAYKPLLRPKKKISRYRFTHKESGQTFEAESFYTDAGNTRLNFTEKTYFNDSCYSRQKIGEEIDCPWE